MADEKKDLEKFKGDFNKAVEKHLKRKELQGKEKPTEADKESIAKLGEQITELLKKVAELVAVAIKEKAFHMYDAKGDACDKKESGACESEITKEGKFKCKEGKCKCKCHVYLSIGGQQFRAEGLMEGAEYGSAPNISDLIPMSCLCVKK